MRYPDEIIEEVRSKNDVVDVISGYVKLQKKGNSYFGLCPFHNEKSPSFSVSQHKQMYYCFGCGAGGNSITFVMDYENYSFSEALKLLADRVGVSLPQIEYSKEAKAQNDQKMALLEMNKLAANYFYYQLGQPQGEVGYRYLKERGLSDQTIRKFGLGYSNKTSDDMYQYLRTKGYEGTLLKESGLVTIEERGSHDKFWNRVMFPIMDVNNRVIGFGGRVMGQGEPKYLNSPETKVFDKSRNLYGLNFARTSREKYILICEGYMDVIAMYQAGFHNAVASLGTSFTSGHAALLKRYVDQVILVYDNDTAGTKAALRAIPILKEVGLSVKVLDLSPYKDPDEFINHLGADEFKERIEKAQNCFLYEIQCIKRNFEMNDPEQKTKFYNEIAYKLLEFSEKLERNNYLQAVAREYFIPVEDLKNLVKQSSAKLAGMPPKKIEVSGGVQYSKKTGDFRKRDKEDGIKKSQRLLLTWLIENPDLFEKVKGMITPDDFVEDLYHQVAQMVFQEYACGVVNPAGILNHFINDEEQYREVAALFNASLNESLSNDEQKKAFLETIIRVRKHSLDYASRNAKDIHQLQEIIKAQRELQYLNISVD